MVIGMEIQTLPSMSSRKKVGMVSLDAVIFFRIFQGFLHFLNTGNKENLRAYSKETGEGSIPYGATHCFPAQ